MTNFKRIHAAGLLALGIALSSLRLFFTTTAHAAEAPSYYASEILLAQCGSASVQEWIDGPLAAQRGFSSPDWYVMALSAQHQADFHVYADTIRNELQTDRTANATSRERLALTLVACEGTSSVCTEVLDSSADGLGIMSRIYALHLLNNGVTSERYSNSQIANELLALQCADGGWSLQGNRGDVDVTAMTIQALAPYRTEPDVAAVIRKGVDFLAASQLASGAYQSYGAENPESTAQVWIALSCLDIDALHDSRFTANGNTLLDGILQFRTADGQYSHLINSTANAIATVQVFLAFTAYDMQQTSAERFYLFHGASPVWKEMVSVSTDSPKTTRAPVHTTSTTAGRTTAAAASGGSSSTHTIADSPQRPDNSILSNQTTAKPAAEVSTVSASGNYDTASETTTPEYSLSTTVRTTSANTSAQTSSGKYPYRIPLTIADALLFGGITLYFVVRRQRSPKTYLPLAIGFCLSSSLIWLIQIESPSQYYSPALHSGGGTVTMEIRCDAILGLKGSEAYPSDGVILSMTEFSIEPDEKVLTLLYDAVKESQLQIEVDGISGEIVETAYVRGIASLYEFDFGDLSGWTYTVNGERPSVGSGAFSLHDGDVVAWIYTINL